MSDIKVIEGLEPWEVMKRASGGEPWAMMSMGEWVEGELSIHGLAYCIYKAAKVAIIDTTTPEIDWDNFDWDFFNQYGGLPAECNAKEYGWTGKIYAPPKNKLDSTVCESPFYYWPSGKCPVPDNVEVEIVFRGDGGNTLPARLYAWGNDNDEGDIIAFKITGRVL